MSSITLRCPVCVPCIDLSDKRILSRHVRDRHADENAQYLNRFGAEFIRCTMGCSKLFWGARGIRTHNSKACSIDQEDDISTTGDYSNNTGSSTSAGRSRVNSLISRQRATEERMEIVGGIFYQTQYLWLVIYNHWLGTK